MNLLKKIIHYLREYKKNKAKKKAYKSKLEELRKRDPFIYKNR